MQKFENIKVSPAPLYYIYRRIYSSLVNTSFSLCVCQTGPLFEYFSLMDIYVQLSNN